jgi:hypothetical protein
MPDILQISFSASTLPTNLPHVAQDFCRGGWTRSRVSTIFPLKNAETKMLHAVKLAQDITYFSHFRVRICP